MGVDTNTPQILLPQPQPCGHLHQLWMDLQRQRKSREKSTRNTLIQELKRGLALPPTCQPCSEILSILVTQFFLCSYENNVVKFSLMCPLRAPTLLGVHKQLESLFVERCDGVGEGDGTRKH